MRLEMYKCVSVDADSESCEHRICRSWRSWKKYLPLTMDACTQIWCTNTDLAWISPDHAHTQICSSRVDSSSLCTVSNAAVKSSKQRTREPTLYMAFNKSSYTLMSVVSVLWCFLYTDRCAGMAPLASSNACSWVWTALSSSFDINGKP